MSRINDILTQARLRAEQQGFNYSGDVTPQEALTIFVNLLVFPAHEAPE